MNIKDKFLSFFGKKETPGETAEVVMVNAYPDSIDYSIYDDPVIEGNLDSKNTLFLVDDFLEQFTLYDLDFRKIKRNFDMDVLSTFKVVSARGTHAGFTAMNFIENTEDISMAVLDLTLETSVKLNDGKLIEFDGIDLAIRIIEKFPDCKILLCTAHSLNKRDPLMAKYISKYNAFKHKVESFNDIYMSKADNRHVFIHLRLKEILNGKSDTIK